jgi:hypothetical protein
MGKEGEKYCVGSEQSAGAPRWNDRGAAACAGHRGAVHSRSGGGGGKEGEKYCVGMSSRRARRAGTTGARQLVRDSVVLCITGAGGRGCDDEGGAVYVCVCRLLTGVLWACVQLQDDRRSEAARGAALVSSADPAGVALTCAVLRQLTSC